MNMVSQRKSVERLREKRGKLGPVTLFRVTYHDGGQQMAVGSGGGSVYFGGGMSLNARLNAARYFARNRGF